MKSGVAFLCVLTGFVFGVGFYHYVLLRGQFPNFNYQLPPKFYRTFQLQSFTKHHNNCPNCPESSPGSDVPIDEVVKGPLLQDDPRLLKYIRQNFLFPPSVPSQPYNLTHSKGGDTSMGQAKMVLRALNYARNGFFIECGALDGELRSNTLMLERRFGWTGLLIEGDPKNFALLQQKYRKAWSSPACLATLGHPHQVLFEQAFNRGRIADGLSDSNKKKSSSSYKTTSMTHTTHSPPPPVVTTTTTTTLVQCFPLFSLLAAMNVTNVDYFSLDIEGAEIAVLENIPFNRLHIKVLSVEYFHAPGGREALRKLMIGKGYRVFGEVRDPIRNWANDLIFIHNSLVP